MSRCRVIWQDTEKNRDVLIHVEYVVEGGVVEIKALYPQKVTLYGEPGGPRVLHVHTDTGRMLLAKAYERSSDDLARLKEEILARRQEAGELEFAV